MILNKTNRYYWYAPAMMSALEMRDAEVVALRRLWAGLSQQHGHMHLRQTVSVAGARNVSDMHNEKTLRQNEILADPVM